MKRELFSELFEFETKTKRKAGDGNLFGKYAFFTSSPMQSKYCDFIDCFGPSLIFGTGGSASIHYCDTAFSASGDCLIAKPKSIDTVNIKFIFYYLLKNLHILENGFKGAGLKHISKNYILNLEVVTPSLKYQNYVVSILDKTDAIRRRRRQAIQLADEFLRSVFLDMFGDPITNPKKWEKGHIKDLCEEIIDCPHATPKYAAEQTEFACIRSSDIQNGYLDWSTTKYVEEAVYRERIKRLEPLPNDVIYCREGARFGNAARIPKGKKLCLGQRMMLFRSNNMLATAEFIWALLNSDSIYHQAVQNIGGSASPHINVADIKKFSVFTPPLNIQEKYSKAVKKLEVVKQKYQSFLLESEQLFNSITQRAFRGEL